jgi:hypothetical protein
MATRNEKILCSLIGGFIGGAIANHNSEYNLTHNAENLFWDTIKGTLKGAGIGYCTSLVFGSSNDTVNYTHYYNGKRVYEGITYADRFDIRTSEHIANGKKFTRIVKDTAKPRVDALRIEKARIKKYKPANNIQHNR